MDKKKIVAIISILALMISMFCFTPDVDAGIQKLNLSKQAKEIKVGESFQLSMNGVKVSSIKWKSSKPKIASVSKKGVVKGLKVGTANITGKYKGLKFTITVKVVSKTKKQEQTDTTPVPDPTPTPTPDTTDKPSAQYDVKNLYLGTCANVDFYIDHIEQYDLYLKVVNNNIYNVNIYIEYMNFDQTTYGIINTFDVMANDFRVFDSINDGEIPIDFKTVSALINVRDNNYDTIDTQNIKVTLK